MKKNIPLLLASLFMATSAYADQPCAKENPAPRTNFYAKIFGGANFLQGTTIDGNKTHYETGYIFTGALGNCWRKYGLSLEAEYAFRRNAIKKITFLSQGTSHNGHFQSSSAMANLLWDLLGCSFWKIQPFIGGGLGYDFQKMHSSNSRIKFHQSWDHFAWQVMAGFSYPIFRNTLITLEYKYHEGGHFKSNSVGMALVYKFGYIK